MGRVVGLVSSSRLNELGVEARKAKPAEHQPLDSFSNAPSPLANARLCAAKPSMALTQQAGPKTSQQTTQQTAQQSMTRPPVPEGRLFKAASLGDAKEMQRLFEEALKSPSDIEALLGDEQIFVGPLEVAAKKGRAHVVELMLDYWTQYPSLRRYIIKRPGVALANAAENGRADVVQIMLKKISEVPELLTFMHSDYGSPLRHAVGGRHYEVVSQLLDFAEKTPKFADWALEEANFALSRAVSNYDDRMVSLLMSSKYYGRFLKPIQNDTPQERARIEEAIAPYVVNL